MRMKARSPHISAQVRSLRVNVCNLLIVIILKIRYKNKLTVTSAGKRPLEGLGVDGRTILECILKK